MVVFWRKNLGNESKKNRVRCAWGLGWGFIAALCGEREFLGLVSMRFFILVPLHLARRNGVF